MDGLVARPDFGNLGQSSVAGLPVDLLILGGVALVGGVVLAGTRYGRSIHAVGGNYEASRLVGLPVARVRQSTFVVSGFLAALAGAIIASKVAVGDASAATTLALDAIAVVVVGGISISGGEGTVWRCMVGLLILAALANLFDALTWPTATRQMTVGAIIVTAITTDAPSTRRRPARR